MQTCGELMSSGHKVDYSTDLDLNKNYDLYILPSSIVCHETEIEYVKLLKKNKKKIIVIGPFATSNFQPYLDAGAHVIKGEPEMFFHKFYKTVNDLNDLPPIIENFAIFPGSETKLLRGLEIGCNGVISAICNVLAPEARRVYDDFKNGKEVHDINEQLIAVRTAFDQHNLISALHTYKSLNNSVYKNVIPPTKLLDENDRRKLFDTLEKLKFRKAA